MQNHWGYEIPEVLWKTKMAGHDNIMLPNTLYTYTNLVPIQENQRCDKRQWKGS